MSDSSVICRTTTFYSPSDVFWNQSESDGFLWTSDSRQKSNATDSVGRPTESDENYFVHLIEVPGQGREEGRKKGGKEVRKGGRMEGRKEGEKGGKKDGRLEERKEGRKEGMKKVGKEHWKE